MKIHVQYDSKNDIKILEQALVNSERTIEIQPNSHEDTEMEEINLVFGLYFKFKDEHERDKFQIIITKLMLGYINNNNNKYR